MTRLKAHFDGKVIVPDEPVDLPTNQKLIVHVEAVDGQGRPRGISGRQFLEAVRKVKISHDDIVQMNNAIEEGCERIDDDAA
jgi:hypothetical protein